MGQELEKQVKQQTQSQSQTTAVDPAKIMYEALVRIAHTDAFFSGEKRLVQIARTAIAKVTKVEF